MDINTSFDKSVNTILEPKEMSDLVPLVFSSEGMLLIQKTIKELYEEAGYSVSDKLCHLTALVIKYDVQKKVSRIVNYNEILNVINPTYRLMKDSASDTDFSVSDESSALKDIVDFIQTISDVDMSAVVTEIDKFANYAGIGEAIQKGESVANEIISGAAASLAGSLSAAGVAAALARYAPAFGRLHPALAVISGMAGGLAMDKAWEKFDIPKMLGLDDPEFKFPEKLHKGLADLLRGAGIDPNGSLLIPFNVIDNWKKNKGQGSGPSLDDAEKASSPIIIDLDRDGVETLSLVNGVYFDHDGNEYQERTGWVSKDDALLVLDRNQNGAIESGHELFGNNTFLPNGNRAANGYEVLKALDDNNDGLIDSNDAVWVSLQLWQDRNSNGKADEGELIKLQDVGIAAIETSYSSSSVIDAQGNAHKQNSVIHYNDQSEGISEDVWFEQNKQDTKYYWDGDISFDISLLPAVSGFGNIPQLHIAMAKNEHLKGLVKEFIKNPEGVGLLDDILYTWAGVDNVDPHSRGNNIDARIISTIECAVGYNYRNKFNGTVDPLPGAAKEILEEFEKFKWYVGSELLIQSKYKEFFSLIHIKASDERTLTLDFSVFEEFIKGQELSNPRLSVTLRALLSKSMVYRPEFSEDVKRIGLTDIHLSLSDELPDILSGERESESAYFFTANHGHDVINDYTSSVDCLSKIFLRGSHTANIKMETRGSSLVIYAYGDTDSVTVSNYFSGNSYRQLVLVCDDGTLTQADLTERVMPQTGTDGNDSLSGWEYGDSISGGAGHDSLRGNNGDDVLDGGTGNDSLYGGAGNDLLDGGAGDDLLDGGNDSADRYVFRQGHGRDTVSDYSSDEDTADTLVFSGARTADLWFEKRGSSLVIYAYGDTDSVTVSNYFSGNSYRQLVLVCDDGTLTQADLTERVMPQTGTDGNDSLSGWEYGDSISGGAGHDSLRGNNGDDVLDGGTGNDSLYGGAGNDLLDGGAGDDLLDGGNDSADRYVFRQGHGRDTVSDYSSDEDTADTLVFSGARTADLWFEKRGSSLVIYAYGDTDSVTVSNYFSGNSYRQLVLVCDDGTLTQADLTERVMPQTGTDGNDSLSGWEYGDSISGGAGHDSLRGNNGDDVLDGGTGNDSLYGGAGNDLLDGGAGDDLLDGGNDSADRYVFRQGHGRDTVSDYSSDEDTADTLVFSGARTADLWFEKRGSSLVIYAYGDTDSVTVSNYFSGNSHRQLVLVCDDGTLTQADLTERVMPQTGTDGNDSLSGWEYGDSISGGAGHDSLRGNNGDDVLDGGTGNDSLYGGAGNDLLDGGAGDDLLDGGNDSADRYVFRQGHGRDTVSDYSSDEDTADTLVFSGARTADLWFEKRGSSLVIYAYGDTDSVTVSNYFSGNSYRQLVLVCDDGTLTQADLTERVMPQTGTDGNDSLSGWEYGDSISGGAGHDSLRGNNGDDVLDGGTGNDSLYGGAGNDLLDGGAGDDLLDGGNDSADRYVFREGHGNDMVSDSSKNSTTADTLVFSGAQSSAVRLEKNGNDLLIRAYGDEDSVRVSGYFSSADYRHIALQFDDRTMTAEMLAGQEFLSLGTEANNNLYGWSGTDRLEGQAGDDYMQGYDGQDTLDGGTGNDKLYGGNDSADRYVFRQGHGRDTVSDYSSDEDTADTLVFSGARTADLWFEKRGSSLVIYAYGDTDSVTVSNYFSGNSYRQLVLVCDDGTLTQADLTERVMPQTGTDGNDSLSGWEYGDSISGGAGHDSLRGNNGDDVLDGGTGNDSLYGGAGNDLLDGGAGDDLLDGGNDSADRYVFREGHGNDMVSDSSKNSTTADTLVFSGAQSSAVRLEKNGNDLLICAYGDEDSVRVSGYFSYADNRHIDLQFDDRTMTAEMLAGQEFLSLGTEANNNLYGWSGTDRLEGQAGDDYMQGYDGQDTLDGGTGNDKLYGGNNSADRYVFREGHGNDMVSDSSKNSTTADTLVFSGAQSSAVRLEKNGNDLLICAYGDEDSVRVSGYFSYADNRHIDLQFDDRTMTAEMLAGQEFLSLGTEANNNLYGWSGTDRLEGQAGDDYMQGYDGQDTLDGGTGNDKLYGGNDSADRYVFREGHGNDMVSDSSKNSTTADTLVFSGAQSSAVRLEKNGNDLLICAYGDEDSVRVSGYFSYADNRHIDLQFDDRTMTAEMLAGQEFLSLGTEANNNLYGWSGTDRLEGQAGDDYMQGYDGQDTLDGGTGNDKLYGGNNSADRYVFREGHGNDMVSDSSKNSTTADTLVFSGAQSSAVRLEKDGNDLLICAYGDEDSVRVSGYFSYADNRHIDLQFDDRTMTAETLAGQEFASEGSATNNTLNGWSGTDRLEGNEGNDSLYGNGGKDTLDGGAGDDGLYGGNDSADRYIFCKGHGHDTVSDYSHDGTTIDTLVFKGANSSKIQTKRSGYHLIIHGYGNEDSVTINNYYHSQNYRFIELRFDDRTLTSEDLGTFTWHWENVSSGRSATPLTSTLSTSNSKEVLISEWPENNTNDLWFQKNDLLGTAVPPSGAAPWGDTESHQLQLMVNAMAGFTTPSEATKSLPEQMQQYMHQLGASAL